ncbi:carboxylesterase/lipase family protein [Haliscomenobacter sp.]|uniref:carboxylesterase/lipase family protein n=1 Tax=Haliscomenobacter sp. TaxID=2717303 RepID=UPI003BAB9131
MLRFLYFFLFLGMFITILPAQTTVTTTYGPISGISEEGALAFKGIPYAKPPVGELRWQAPQPPAPWSQTRMTADFSPKCPQKNFSPTQDSATTEGEEDCLYLNVWTPALTGKRPVLFFIHGGGNQQGSASETLNGGAFLYTGKFLASRKDVVVVTINYRLGALGFMSHPAVAAASSSKTSGNYGTMDQILALEWVRDNIAKFGGDPGNVMVFGESAGAVNTSLLLTIPSAKGLFHRAGIQSGSPIAAPYVVGENFSKSFASRMGCATGSLDQQLQCLKALPVSKIIAELESPLSGGKVTLGWGPVVDGLIIPKDPASVFLTGQHNKMPVLIGSNADEMSASSPLVVTPAQVRTLFDAYVPEAYEAEGLTLYPPGTTNAQARQSYIQTLTDAQFTAPARRLAKGLDIFQTEPVWRYLFSHAQAGVGAIFGAAHGLELPFLFQSIEETNYGKSASFNNNDKLVAKALMDYWTNFARTGNPNGTGLTVWPPYDYQKDPYLDIKSPVASAEGLRTQKSDYWDRVRGVATSTRQPLSLLGVKMEVPALYQEGARIKLNLEEGLKLRLELFNLLGQKLGQVFEGELSAGAHELDFHIPEHVSGLVILRAQAGGGSMAVKVWKQ